MHLGYLYKNAALGFFRVIKNKAKQNKANENSNNNYNNEN